MYKRVISLYILIGALASLRRRSVCIFDSSKLQIRLFKLYTMSNHALVERLKAAKPFFAVVFLQFGLAGMDILCKAALNQGVSNYVLVVYRHAVATVVVAPFAVILDKYVSDSISSLLIFMQTQNTHFRKSGSD